MSLKSQLNTANKAVANYGKGYAYKGAAQTKYNQANTAYENFIKNGGDGKFKLDKYITQVNDLFKDIMDYGDFSYDPQKDQLFQMYKQQYKAQGNKAMNNLMGVGAAYSGGYNSSAAQTAAQSTYQGYMDDLSNKAADTYQNALNMWKYKQQNLIDKYNITRDMNNDSNNAYWKQAETLQNMRNNAYNVFQDDRSYGASRWDANATYWQKRADSLQNQINWQADYALSKKKYKGK